MEIIATSLVPPPISTNHVAHRPLHRLFNSRPWPRPSALDQAHIARAGKPCGINDGLFFHLGDSGGDADDHAWLALLSCWRPVIVPFGQRWKSWRGVTSKSAMITPSLSGRTALMPAGVRPMNSLPLAPMAMIELSLASRATTDGLLIMMPRFLVYSRVFAVPVIHGDICGKNLQQARKGLNSSSVVVTFTGIWGRNLGYRPCCLPLPAGPGVNFFSGGFSGKAFPGKAPGDPRPGATKLRMLSSMSMVCELASESTPAGALC